MKYNEDELLTNTFYAKIGGISVAETNLLEVEFIKLINYRLYVSEEEYKMYVNHIVFNK